MHDRLKARVLAEISDLIDANSFTNGPQVAHFEQLFAAYCGTDDCVGVASGLDGLRLALLAAGARPGDEVIVPANTFVATLEAVTQARCSPVVVDVDEGEMNIDVAATAAAIGPRTRFLLPVHLYGQMADVARLRDIASKAGVGLVEDACQAHGASRDGVRAGTAGVAAAFSFYPGKNLGAFGDAGAVTTDNAVLAERIRVLREHGQSRKYHHDVEGWTSRLDTIQAIVLRHKLPHLDEANESRHTAAAFYAHELEGVGDLLLPQILPGSAPVWHLYVVRTAGRDRLAEFLRNRGIGTGLHYPQPVHLAPAYAWLGHRDGEFPVAEQLARDVLSLPMFPGISEEQLQTVVVAICEYFAGAR